MMRNRSIRLFPVVLAALLFGATEVYAQAATVVTHSGQHLTGQVVSVGDTVVLRSNGRSRQAPIPIQDVAFIDFAGNGTVSQTELDRANQSNGFVVLRSGRTVTGRLADFQGASTEAIVSGRSGDQSIPTNQIARVYFGNGSYNNSQYGNAPNTYGDSGSYGNNGRRGRGQSAGARTVTIQTNQAWSDSGMDVRRGQVIHFRASGRSTLSDNQADYATPAGSHDGRTAGNSPLPGVTAGMLVGRVGNGQPFAIGAESDVTMPDNGRLTLGVNDDFVGDNTGSFVVEMAPR